MQRRILSAGFLYVNDDYDRDENYHYEPYLFCFLRLTVLTYLPGTVCQNARWSLGTKHN